MTYAQHIIGTLFWSVNHCIFKQFNLKRMGITMQEHRVRTGLFGNVIASRPGTRKLVSLVNINFNLTSLCFKLYRQTSRDDTGQTKATSISLLNVLLLYIYVIFLSSMLLICQTIMPMEPQKTVFFSGVDKLGHTNSCRYLLNWGIITILFLSKKDVSIFKNIYLSYRAKRSSKSSYWMMPLTFLKNSALFYTTTINLFLIVITTPSIVNPGPQIENPLKVAYCNAQGFIMMSSMKSNQPIFQTNKLLDFQSHLHHDKPDFVVLNETWLNEHINSNEIVDEQYYKCFRLDRSIEDKLKYNKVGGGGVMILCRQDLDVDMKLININCKLPILSIEIKFKDKSKFCLSTFYRYGYSDEADYLESEQYYRALCRRYKDIVLVGDLNLSTVRDWSCPIAGTEIEGRYIDLFNDLGLIPLVNSSTHRAGNTLDQIFTNRTNFIQNLSIIPDGICSSDHYSLNFEIQKPKKKKKIIKKRVFAYKRGDWDSVNRDFRNFNWYNIFSNNLTTNLNSFKSMIDITLRKHVPMVNIQTKGQPPWFDSEIREMKKVKTTLRKRSKSENASPQDEEEFKKYEKLYKQRVTSKMKDFITKVDPGEDDNVVINKRFWSHIKSNSNCSRIPDSVYYNGRYRTEAHDKCELFNSFFSAQFSETSIYDIHVDRYFDPLFNINFSSSDVYNFLKNVNPSKAAGPDGIDGYVLKKCCSSLSLPLSILFQISYNTGDIPQDWKNANVVPIHKKKDKANVENYRPISLTSLIMKIFEKCIRAKLFDLCADKITECQHGFLPGRSCNTQMLEFTNDLALNLNSSLQTDIVYFDFAKAFDSVSHDLILHKLKYNFGINGMLLNFIQNYLKNRQQRVVIDGKFSSWESVRSGVPQGSVLGPILFVLFINDIVNEISPHTKILLYADDMKIWKVIDTIEDQNALQLDIDNLHQWSVDNKMKFHPSKCKILRSTLKINYILTSYNMANTPLDIAESERDLGIIIHPKLLYRNHHQAIIAKSSQKLGLVKRNCSFTKSIKSRKVLYLSLVRSLYEHCSPIWRPVNITQINKFERIQKRAIKWIFNEDYARYSCLDYFNKLKSLKILPLDLKFELNDMVIFHKIFYDYSIVKIPYFLVTQSDRSNATYFQRQTRTYNDNDRLKIKCTIRPRKDVFKNCFFYRSHLFWNSLPLEIRALENPEIFKGKLEDHLWQLAERNVNGN